MPAKSLLVSRGLGAHAAGISDAPGLLVRHALQSCRNFYIDLVLEDVSS